MLKTNNIKIGLKALAVASLATFAPCSKVAEKAAVSMPKNNLHLKLPARIEPALCDATYVARGFLPPLGKDTIRFGEVRDLPQKYDEPFFTSITDYVSRKWLSAFDDKKIFSAEDFVKTFESGDTHSKKKHGQLYYKVYYGEADKTADLAQRFEGQNVAPLLTVGHGHTQRGAIEIHGKKLKEGDLISEKQADSLLFVDMNKKKSILKSFVQKSMSKHEQDAVLSYMFNVDWKTLAKSDSTRLVKESMFECLNQGKKGLAQSKFNIISAGGIEQPGLIIRRLSEMVVFGNGEIYRDENAQKTFVQLVEKLNQKKGIKGINKVVQTLKNYGIQEAKTDKIKAQMLAIVHPEN